MDFNSLLHAYNKIMADRATSNTTVRGSDDAPPPAYSTLTTNSTTQQPRTAVAEEDLDSVDTASDSDCEAEDDNTASSSATPSPTLAVDAATVIHGSSNVIAVPPVDGPRLTAILLSLLHGTLPTQIQAQQQQQQAAAQSQGHRPSAVSAPLPHLPGHLPGDDGGSSRNGNSKRPLNIRIDCGVRVVGDRNVIGGLAPPVRMSSSSSSAGTGSPPLVAARQQNGGVMADRGDGQAVIGARGVLTPPGTPPSSAGGGAGSIKRKAEEVAEAEGRAVKKERADGADGKI
ncbi:hypothetical protein DIS24_g3711 [Lasiodiplodia hormozganensis]|uniref:Uncharacterized protein n=1 Tax=Lasiodiplodia hormozganensis TaxID=869390 RepID=A0AA40D467_9PEZI|nr:hypothetical protein DIS24_g3711 [Lasiodiplodia hormozganensis]